MRKRAKLFCCLLIVALIGLAGPSAAQESLVDWSTIFNADGSIRDLGGGVDAIFLQDNISAGVATDMTALDAANNLVYNGPVSKAHDLGNGYVYVTRDLSGNPVLSAAAERFVTDKTTYVEFEFNQAVVGVMNGNPWPIYGQNTINDIKVLFRYVNGNLASVDYGIWDGSSYKVHSSPAPSPIGCFIDSSLNYEYCNGDIPAGLPEANLELWDNNFQFVQVPSTDGLVEVQINLDPNVEFSSVMVRTPEDVIFGSFQAMGYWAALN